MIASEKNRGVLDTILASIFFTPFVVYLYLLAVPAKEKQKKIVYVRDIPNKHNANNPATGISDNMKFTYRCKRCHQVFSYDTTNAWECPSCGGSLIRIR